MNIFEMQSVRYILIKVFGKKRLLFRKNADTIYMKGIKMTTNTMTRLAGYKASRGKEAESQAIFEDFADHYGLNIEEIKGYDNNRLHGDWKLNGKKVEVKSQNIGKYSSNFFELGEVTDKEYHADGWKKLVDLMESKGVDMNRYGSHKYFNFGFTPVTNGAMAFYINRETSLIYIYSSAALIEMIADSVKNKGIQIGLGKANKDTVSCFIPNSKVSFQKIDGVWTYTGTVEENIVMNKLGVK
jgi:hypothetical protein